MAREFTRVGVVGLGTMGAGISEVFARNGLEVVAVERDESALPSGIEHVETSTSRAVKRGKLSEEEKQAIFDRITFTSSLEDLADCHLVVEAVPEKLELKQQIFAELDRITAPDAILATNTSSLSVTEISVATHRPAQVVGMHFFNPAPVLKLVEVIRTVVTDAQVIDDVKALQRATRQGSRRRWRQGGVHRQRAPVRLPQPRRCRCTSSATRPARTSTPR